MCLSLMSHRYDFLFLQLPGARAAHVSGASLPGRELYWDTEPYAD